MSSFNELREEFDMGLESLAELPFNTRAYALRDIYEQYKDEFEKGLWKKIIVRTNREIDRKIKEKSEYGSYYLDPLKDLKTSMEIAKGYLAYRSWYSLSINDFFSFTDFDDDERKGITKEIAVVEGVKTVPLLNNNY